MTETWLEKVGLRLTLQYGEYEGKQDVLLFLCDRQGNAIPTGFEGANQTEKRAQQAEQKLAQLEANLRELIDPDANEYSSS